MTKILVLHSSTSCGIIHPHHRFIMAVICPVGTFLISGLLMPSTSVDLLQACSNFIFCKFAVSFTMLDVWIFSICQVYYIPSFQPVKVNTFYILNIWVYLFCIVQAEVATNNVVDSSLFCFDPKLFAKTDRSWSFLYFDCLSGSSSKAPSLI